MITIILISCLIVLTITISIIAFVCCHICKAILNDEITRNSID